jgi:hypothetical protein
METSSKVLPSVEQVEEIMKDWGRFTVEEFASRFQLEKEIVEATVAYLHKLKRISDDDSISVMVCYRDDKLESIVRCAGARHGYIG